MAEKNFLSWVGFKGEDANKPAPSQNALERIRELESQLNDLRSRKDITGLSREEFEILATETAMSMIKSAQQREAKAKAARDASQITSSAKKEAQRLVESAAKNIVDYRSWLSSAISEAERLHRTQNASLNAAEHAIQESRQKLKHAFDRLSQLQMDINANLDGENKPVSRTYVAGAGKKAAAAAARKQKAANNKNNKKKK
ncbi:MAG: hypothetical protein EBU41_01060 [Actinobacteria bacterium]|nr:hypothetical protein [Actinomycetota bacterium]